MKIYLLLILSSLFFLACQTKTNQTTEHVVNRNVNWYETANEDELLDSVQYQTFHYFWEFAEPTSGLARERYIPSGEYPQNDANIVTTGGTGFGLMAMVAAIDREFITLDEGIERFQKMVNFLEKSDRYHGAWSHWINGETGKTKPFGKFDNGGDLVETAFLVQGLLVVRQYVKEKAPEQEALINQIDELWKGVDWAWYTQGKDEALYWHWSPDYDWKMNFPLKGYDETMITYVLAASSPTHATSTKPYNTTWARGGDIVANDSAYGVERVLDHYSGGNNSPFGPLFWAHYSYLGLNPTGLSDQYADYWKLNTNHALAHYNYAQENPKNFKGYGPNIWGMTSSYTRNKDGGIGYTAHRPDQDNSVISPTAAISSIPYTPKQSIEAIKGFYSYSDMLLGPAGFYDAFSLEHDWVVDRYLAIDQGPIIVMIENYRSGLIWDLFMSCPEIKNGLNKLGFKSTNYTL